MLGETTVKQGQWTTQLRSLFQQMQQPLGVLFQLQCGAELGDAQMRRQARRPDLAAEPQLQARSALGRQDRRHSQADRGQRLLVRRQLHDHDGAGGAAALGARPGPQRARRRRSVGPDAGRCRPRPERPPASTSTRATTSIFSASASERRSWAARQTTRPYSVTAGRRRQCRGGPADPERARHQRRDGAELADDALRDRHGRRGHRRKRRLACRAQPAVGGGGGSGGGGGVASTLRGGGVIEGRGELLARAASASPGPPSTRARRRARCWR